MNELQKTIYDRFVKYVSFDTTSDGTKEFTPTTPCQIEFAKILERELHVLGVSGVSRDTYGFVTGTIPSNLDKKVPVIGLFAHMDTVSDFSGKNIRPQIHPNYDGGVITIHAEKKMTLSPLSAPNLQKCIGHDIVTADGTTLLAGDDKIGIAVMMTLAEHLLAHPEIKHGDVKLAFTVDEETGTGIASFDMEKFGADLAYTIDGGELGDIDCGNFNADTVTISITGKSCHPGSAKGFMANPVRIAADIISSWPETKLPETTDKEDGFILFKDITGDLEKASVGGIVREHHLKKFEQFKEELRLLIEEKKKKYPAAKITLQYKKQYRNMKDVLDANPLAMNLLQAALKTEGVPYRLTQARGGTDGAQLTLRGLPTPNIFAGYESAHGPYEWLSMQWVEKTFYVVLGVLKEAAK